MESGERVFSWSASTSNFTDKPVAEPQLAKVENLYFRFFFLGS